MELWERVRGRYYRTGAKWFCRKPVDIVSPVPYISFTFDDFPRTALSRAGRILRQAGAGGTYYAALGLLGRHNDCGEMFTAEDLAAVGAEGHELGCHTYDHYPSSETAPREFEASVERNREALAGLLPGARFATFSYPINAPRVGTKFRVARRFRACRGGGQTFNHQAADLNYLAAFFIEQSRNAPERIWDVIEQNRRANGWLIFATHDVCEDPSPYGCRPELFEAVVERSLASGARVLPVTQVLEALGCPATA